MLGLYNDALKRL